MKIATYNVNGIRARLPLLRRWPGEQSPDIVCLEELKAPQEPHAPVLAKVPTPPSPFIDHDSGRRNSAS